jgi:hypothetical protein
MNNLSIRKTIAAGRTLEGLGYTCHDGELWKPPLGANPSPLLARIIQLQAEAEALRKDAEWQPIETAPKDGTEILVSFNGLGVKCVAWTTRWDDPTDEHAHWHIDDNKNDPHPLRGYSEGDELGWKPLPQSLREIKHDH